MSLVARISAGAEQSFFDTAGTKHGLPHCEKLAQGMMGVACALEAGWTFYFKPPFACLIFDI